METVSVLPINFFLSSKKYAQTADDLLKCGSCRTEFLLSDICVFIQHKTSLCKLNEQKQSEDLTSSVSSNNDLLCGTCPEKFYDARSLLEHAQYTHKINIFVNSTSSSSPSTLEVTNTVPQSSSSSNTSTTTTTTTTTNNIEIANNKKNPTNEIFIDFVQSDKRSDNRYNITVSSSSSNNGNNSMEHDRENNNMNTSVNNNNNNNNNKTIINMSPKKKLLSYSYNNLVKNSMDDGNSNGNEVKIEANSNPMNKDDENNTGIQPTTSTSSVLNNNSFSLTDLNSDNGNLSIDLKDNSCVEKKTSKILNKPFYCEICDLKFNQKIHLIKHSAKHTGIKPFKCTECSYSTVERSHLKVHIRIHTGEKPFKCTYCEYATAQSSTLKIHKKRHHNALNESGIELKHQSLYITSTSSSSGNQVSNSRNSSNKSQMDTDDDNTNDHYIITNGSFNDSSNDVIEISNYREEEEQEKNHKKFKKSEKKKDDNKLLGLADIALKNENEIKS